MSKNCLFLIREDRDGREFQFLLRFHTVSAPQELLIDDSFYREFGQLPFGEHIEIEILSPEIWDHPLSGKIHFKHGKDPRRFFVCYPRRVETPEKALDISIMWVMGTTYTMIYSEDFQTIPHGNNKELLKKLRESGIDMPMCSVF